MPARKKAPSVLAEPAPSTYVANVPILEIGAGAFKDRCLQLLDDVRERNVEIVVTKHGEPVARLVAPNSAAPSAFGFLRGSITKEHKLLLDTHIWLWHLAGNATKLSTETIDLLDRAGRNTALHVSDISYWEVAVKAAKGKLALSMDVTIWLKRAERAPGTRFLSLDRDTLLLSTRLQGAMHNDSADRMLIATAKIHNIPLVTADGLIVEYARKYPGTPVVDARLPAGRRGT